MRRTLRFHAEAIQDASDTFRWYEQERLGLGRRFLRDVDALLERARVMPERNPLVGASTRRALAVRFPYIVFCVVESGEILITGIFHSRRDPRSWADRVREGVARLESTAARPLPA